MNLNQDSMGDSQLLMMKNAAEKNAEKEEISLKSEPEIDKEKLKVKNKEKEAALSSRLPASSQKNSDKN